MYEDEQDIPDLFQRFSYEGEKYIKNQNGEWVVNYHHTDGKIPYNNLAYKKLNILLENTRIAEFAVTVRLLKVFTKEERAAIWKKVSEYLRKHKITYVRKVEPTRSRIDKLRYNRGDPMDYEVKITNRVHEHYLVDHIDTKKKLGTAKDVRQIFENAFSRVLAPGQFEVDMPKEVKDEADYHSRLFYFTKFNQPRRVILFQSGMGERIYFASRSWWITADGTTTTQEKLWEPVKERCEKWAQGELEKEQEQERKEHKEQYRLQLKRFKESLIRQQLESERLEWETMERKNEIRKELRRDCKDSLERETRYEPSDMRNTSSDENRRKQLEWAESELKRLSGNDTTPPTTQSPTPCRIYLSRSRRPQVGSSKKVRLVIKRNDWFSNFRSGAIKPNEAINCWLNAPPDEPVDTRKLPVMFERESMSALRNGYNFIIGDYNAMDGPAPIWAKSMMNTSQERYIGFFNALRDYLKANEQYDLFLILTDLEWEAMLDEQTDETYCDWSCSLIGEPTIYNTVLPQWILDIKRVNYEKYCYLRDELRRRLNIQEHRVYHFSYPNLTEERYWSVNYSCTFKD